MQSKVGPPCLNVEATCYEGKIIQNTVFDPVIPFVGISGISKALEK
jgi:hypothetical protein